MPSQLKSRDELPWLYYPRSNSVRVINSHLGGGGGGSLAVNGKMPVAAWVPSLDTAGNGTTTLTDLVGSNNGTLTNMDAATDWVADTGAGGVRALDFDGTDDYVGCGSVGIVGDVEVCMSFWVNVPLVNSAIRAFCGFGTSGALSFFSVFTGLRGAGSVSIEYGGDTPYTATGLVANQWQHIVAQKTAGAIRTTSQIYIDGSLQAAQNTASTSSPSFGPGVMQIARVNTGSYYSGLMDDIRIFDQALDATDVAYLSASRGRTA